MTGRWPTRIPLARHSVEHLFGNLPDSSLHNLTKPSSTINARAGGHEKIPLWNLPTRKLLCCSQMRAPPQKRTIRAPIMLMIRSNKRCRGPILTPVRSANTRHPRQSDPVRPPAGIVAILLGAAALTLGAPTAAAEVPPDQVALSTLDEIVRGDYPAAAADFNPTMQSLLPTQALQQSWELYQQVFGAYQSHGAPENIQRGDVTVVNVPLQMTRRTGQFRLTVQPDGSVASLTFLKEGVPVP